MVDASFNSFKHFDGLQNALKRYDDKLPNTQRKKTNNYLQLETKKAEQ